MRKTIQVETYIKTLVDNQPVKEEHFGTGNINIPNSAIGQAYAVQLATQYHAATAEPLAKAFVNAFNVSRGDLNAAPGLPAPAPAIVETATQYHERTTRERERQLAETDLYKSAEKFRHALLYLTTSATRYRKIKQDPNATATLKESAIEVLLEAADQFAALSE